MNGCNQIANKPDLCRPLFEDDMEELWKTLASGCVRENNAQRPLLLAVDRDGTLVPISDDPEEAVVPHAVKDQLRLLASFSMVTVAAVSARPVEKLASDFGEGALILAGNYGLEISFPDGKWDIQGSALDARPDLVKVKKELLNQQFAELGVILEDHLYTLCAHWHLVKLENQAAVHNTIAELAARTEGVKLIRRPTSYEFFPPMEWDKAHALERIYKDLHEAYLPVYFGDSDADECAFDWVNKHGGISVRVGPIEPQSCARFNVESPSAVHQILDRLADLLIVHEQKQFKSTSVRASSR